jgi:hypothetical protein
MIKDRHGDQDTSHHRNKTNERFNNQFHTGEIDNNRVNPFK